MFSKIFFKLHEQNPLNYQVKIKKYYKLLYYYGLFSVIKYNKQDTLFQFIEQKIYKSIITSRILNMRI